MLSSHRFIDYLIVIKVISLKTIHLELNELFYLTLNIANLK